MTEFTVRILALAAPGIIGYLFLMKLVGDRKKTPTASEFITKIAVMAIAPYVVISLIESIYRYADDLGFNSTIWAGLWTSERGINPIILIVAILVNIVFAYIASATMTYNIINRIGRILHATKRYGDEDLWHYFHNASDQLSSEWFLVRDQKNNFTYYGWVQVWSDSDCDRELIMRDVTVYDSLSAEQLYELSHLYLCRSKYDISIEIPSPQDVSENS